MRLLGPFLTLMCDAALLLSVLAMFAVGFVALSSTGGP